MACCLPQIADNNSKCPLRGARCTHMPDALWNIGVCDQVANYSYERAEQAMGTACHT